MILDIFKKAMITVIDSSTKSTNLKSTSSNTFGVSNTDIRSMLSDTNSNYCSILIGTGNTTPQTSDYKLANQANLTSMGRTSVKPEDGSNLISVTQTYTNNTSNSVTIQEIGLCGYHSGLKLYFLFL